MIMKYKEIEDNVPAGVANCLEGVFWYLFHELWNGDGYKNRNEWIKMSTVCHNSTYGSGQGTVAVLLPGFAINW